MVRNILIQIVILSFFISCSNDKENNEEQLDESSQLQGKWNAKAMKIDDQTASDEAKFGSDILDFLTENSCTIISFTFNADLSLVAESSADYISINVNGNGSGLDIPCPTESDIDTTVYTYDGTTLTFADADGKTISLTPVIEGNIMTITAVDLGFANFDAEGELVFEKM